MSSNDETFSRLRPFGIMFEKSLHGLIKGMRACKTPTSTKSYIKKVLAECHTEAKSQDLDVKSIAILKLTYLQMYGYDMSWASFYVLEVMASFKFQQKRIGYLAAITSFRSDTDVLMLTTNLLKKDLSSGNTLEVAVAISGIANIVSPSLAQDLSEDILKMVNHSRPYVRKKAVLAMYKVFLQYPDALKSSFPRLRDKLADPDPSVVSATVNVICELAKNNNPKNYLPLAPHLFDLLNESSTNNWTLIKIIKLFSALTPIEPRLKNKILPPIINIIETTPAMSLLYESISCVVSSGMLDYSDVHLANLIVQKLSIFFNGTDQNLKYVALLAYSKLVRVHPQIVSSQQDLILQCVDDEDIAIRQQTLALLDGIVSEDNIFEIVKRLLIQLLPPHPLSSSSSASAKLSASLPTNQPSSFNKFSNTSIETKQANEVLARTFFASFALSDTDASSLAQPSIASNSSNALNKSINYLPEFYRMSLVEKILSLCSQNSYENISSFDWYLSVLLDLVKVTCKTDISTINTTLRSESAGEDSDNPISEEDNSNILGANVTANTVFSRAYTPQLIPIQGVGKLIGEHIRDLAVRVPEIRAQVVYECALLLISTSQSTKKVDQDIILFAIFVIGEYATILPDAARKQSVSHSSNEYNNIDLNFIEITPENIIDAIISLNSPSARCFSNSMTLSMCIQAMPKIFYALVYSDSISQAHTDDKLNNDDILSSQEQFSDEFATIFSFPSSVKDAHKADQQSNLNWNNKKIHTLLVYTRKIISWLTHYSSDYDLEIYERSSEFLEFFKLVEESLTSKKDNYTSSKQEKPTQLPKQIMSPPMLLSHTLPKMFNSWELNPIAPSAQSKIPFLDSLSDPIVSRDEYGLDASLTSESEFSESEDEMENQLESEVEDNHYKDIVEEDKKLLSGLQSGSKSKEREQRYRDDPFYILDSISIHNKTKSSSIDNEDKLKDGVSKQKGSAGIYSSHDSLHSYSYSSLPTIESSDVSSKIASKEVTNSNISSSFATLPIKHMKKPRAKVLKDELAPGENQDSSTKSGLSFSVHKEANFNKSSKRLGKFGSLGNVQLTMDDYNLAGISHGVSNNTSGEEYIVNDLSKLKIGTETNNNIMRASEKYSTSKVDHKSNENMKNIVIYPSEEEVTKEVSKRSKKKVSSKIKKVKSKTSTKGNEKELEPHEDKSKKKKKKSEKSISVESPLIINTKSVIKKKKKPTVAEID